MVWVFDSDSFYIPIVLGEVVLVGGDTVAVVSVWFEAIWVDPGCAKVWMYWVRVEWLGGDSVIAVWYYRQVWSLGYGWQVWVGEIDVWLHV